jgi:DNA-binding transcriptional regulator YiaG
MIKKEDLLPYLGRMKDIDIAKKFNITRERVRQIRQHYKIDKYSFCTSEHRVKNIKDAINNNKGIVEICKENHMCFKSVKKLLDANNIEYKHKRKNQKCLLSSLTMEEFKKMKENATMSVIAKNLGVSVTTLFGWVCSKRSI